MITNEKDSPDETSTLACKKAELASMEIEIKFNLRRLIFLEDESHKMNNEFEAFCSANKEFKKAINSYYAVKVQLKEALSVSEGRETGKLFQIYLKIRITNSNTRGEILLEKEIGQS